MMNTNNSRRSLRASDHDGSPSWKFPSKLGLSLVVILIFLTIAQCTVKKPEAPEWTSRVVIPVINRTYDMAELVRKMDQDEISLDSLGNVNFSLTEQLDTIGLGQDDLSTPDMAYNVTEQLGVIDIDPPVIAPVLVYLNAIGLPAFALPGDTAIVPDTTFTVSNDITVGSFSTATISTGQMNVTISNALGLTLDNISIDLVNASNDQVITSGTHGSPLASGSVAIIPIPLSGRTLPGNLKIVSSYHTPWDTVTAFSTRFVETSVAFSNPLQITSAVAEVPALSRSFSSPVALGESDRIDTASLATGTLSLTIDNATNLDAGIVVTMADLISQAGQVLVINTTAPANNSVVVAVDLAGYKLIPTDVTVPQDLLIDITANIAGSGGSQVAIAAVDSFNVQASMTNLTFGSVTGVFQNISANFANITQDLDIPTGFDSISLSSAILTLEIENAVDIPGTLNIQLSGNNGKNLSITGAIDPKGLATSTVSVFVDTSVANFLSPLPSQITISGDVTFGDGVYVGTISENDYVVGTVTIEAPMEMIIAETKIDIDPESTDLDLEDMDKIISHFIEGRFIYNITNHLPLGASLNVYFGTDSATVYTSPIDSINVLNIVAGTVNGAGIVIDASVSGDQEIILDSAQVANILANDTLWIGPDLTLAGSGGQAVKLMGSDYLTITGRVEVTYRFDGEF